ncbi:MAG: transporter substrate-binding domain-containing protein [Candidatus Azotimanducaceae bacterium WSBS_2022_MAG_OTU7]
MAVTLKKHCITGLVALAAGVVTTMPAFAGTLDDVIERGKLIAGVKADYAPWGMRDASGNVVGMEIDMMRDLAKQIGEKAGKEIDVELVVVVASNRMQFLEQGKIDIMIATMSDKAERREVVGIVQPNYYSSGVAVLAHKDSGIGGWDTVKDKKVCGIQGAWYNKDHGLKNGAEIMAFKGVPEVEAALLDGRCVGWLYDDSAFVPRKVNAPEKWADYNIATTVVDNVPWGAAVRKEDIDQPIGKALSAAIISWHKSGTLIELEKKWGVPATQWLVDMQTACNAGDNVCNDVHDEGE